MVEYINKLVHQIQVLSGTEDEMSELSRLLPVLVQELDRLDPRDFLAEARHDFVNAKATMAQTLKEGYYVLTAEAHKACEVLIACLGKYGGEGSRHKTRTFDFIGDASLREIIERDYTELSAKAIPSGAWKSSVVLAGSILEAVLYDTLTATQEMIVKAKKSEKAPEKRDLEKGEWTLAHLIDVAVDVGAIPEKRAASIDLVLRDYRNFVHPLKEIRAAHACTEAEATMSKGALDGVCNILKGKSR